MLLSKNPTLLDFIILFKDCEQCNKQDIARICHLLEDNNLNQNQPHDPMLETTTCEIVAADKVALIISNRNYESKMANLITPHCDAETLAENLQQMKFKTVTLGDLKLEEMRFIIKEYRKLLG